MSEGLRTAARTLDSFPGFVESLTLIFMSELGDKTFFIAALLAMRLGRGIAFCGSVVALGAMTVISVAFGQLFSRVPAFMQTSAPIGRYFGAACLVYFGAPPLLPFLVLHPRPRAHHSNRRPAAACLTPYSAVSLSAACSGHSREAAGARAGVRSLATGLKQGKEGEELMSAEEEMEQAEKDGRIKAETTLLSAFWEVVTLIFLAEWGDRSMLATIALAVHANPVGVTLGATLGHALATVIAVVAGAVASKYISERVVNLVGGSLFLLFAAETAFGLGIL